MEKITDKDEVEEDDLILTVSKPHKPQTLALYQSKKQKLEMTNPKDKEKHLLALVIHESEQKHNIETGKEMAQEIQEGAEFVAGMAYLVLDDKETKKLRKNKNVTRNFKRTYETYLTFDNGQSHIAHILKNQTSKEQERHLLS